MIHKSGFTVVCDITMYQVHYVLCSTSVSTLAVSHAHTCPVDVVSLSKKLYSHNESHCTQLLNGDMVSTEAAHRL